MRPRAPLSNQRANPMLVSRTRLKADLQTYLASHPHSIVMMPASCLIGWYRDGPDETPCPYRLEGEVLSWAFPAVCIRPLKRPKPFPREIRQEELPEFDTDRDISWIELDEIKELVGEEEVVVKRPLQLNAISLDLILQLAEDEVVRGLEEVVWGP